MMNAPNRAAAQKIPAPSEHRFLRVIALLFLTTVAYIPALSAGFIWDDTMYVSENPSLRSLQGLWNIWFVLGETPQYYPLVFTTFWIEHQIWDANPMGYHVVNILLHGCVACLLWIALRRLSVPGAWVAAAVFALHPVHVESVAWITERKNVLSASLYLSALLAYMKFDPFHESLTDPTHQRRWGWYIVAIALFAGALFSKTVTCTLPPAIALLMWWKRGRLRLRDVLPLVPMLIMGGAMGVVTAWMEKTHVGASGAEWDFSVVERVLIAGRAVWFYAASLVWPFDLIFIYPRWTIDAGAWWQYVFPIAAAVFVLILWVMRARIGRGPLTAALYFGGTLMPALGFVNVYPMRFSFVADHFQYLASIGVITLLTAVVAVALHGYQRWVQWCVAGTILIGLGTLSFRQTHMYRDVETLWRQTLARNPGAWIAHNNLSALLLSRGDHEQAAVHANTSLTLHQNDEVAHNNLGLALEYAGQTAHAIEQYQLAIAAAPRFARSHLNLATLLHRLNRTAEAETHYRLAIEYSPRFAEAHYNFAVYLASADRLADAIEACRTAIALNPADADARCLLGYMQYITGNESAGLEEIRAALRIDPGHGRARSLLQGMTVP